MFWVARGLIGGVCLEAFCGALSRRSGEEEEEGQPLIHISGRTLDTRGVLSI